MTNKLAMCHVCSGFGQVALGASMGQPCWECNGMGMVTVKVESKEVSEETMQQIQDLLSEPPAQTEALKELMNSGEEKKKKTRSKKND